ncbi:MAG: DUF1648 domain-containing protein [Tannerellaceae bacterium]|nr:DUF1648 domain-containing protein [Tannerellaceae bacterium]
MNNPRRKTTCDHLLEIVSLVILGATIFPFIHFGKLAKMASIPIHFGINGKVDGWENPYLLWFIPAIAITLYMGLTYIERQYKKFHYPVKIKNEEMADAIYRLGICLIRHIKPVVLAIFCFISNSVFLVATHRMERLCMPVFYVLIGCFFIVILFYLVKMTGLRKRY